MREKSRRKIIKQELYYTLITPFVNERMKKNNNFNGGSRSNLLKNENETYCVVLNSESLLGRRGIGKRSRVSVPMSSFNGLRFLASFDEVVVSMSSSKFALNSVLLNL